MVKVKRVGVMSLGKVLGVLYAMLGLIVGALFSLFSIVGAIFSPDVPGALGLVGVGSIIFFPIFYGLMGLVFGMITALLYNLVASWVGGIELETG